MPHSEEFMVCPPAAAVSKWNTSMLSLEPFLVVIDQKAIRIIHVIGFPVW